MDQIKITCACIKAGDILLSKKTTIIPTAPNRCIIPHNATRFSLGFSDMKYDHDDFHKPIQWNMVVTHRTQANFDIFLETHLSTFLCNFFTPSDAVAPDSPLRVQCVTEIQCGNPRLGQLRGHWNYQGNGRFNDWVLVHANNLNHADRADNYQSYASLESEFENVTIGVDSFPIIRSSHTHILSDWGQFGGPKVTSRNLNRMQQYDPGNFPTHRNQFVPCQILFFCFMPQTDHLSSEEKESPYVLLRPCYSKQDSTLERMDSVLFTRWRKKYDDNLHPSFVIMPLSTLFERVFVVEDDPAQYQQNIHHSWAGQISSVQENHAMSHSTKSGWYPSSNQPQDQIHDLCYVSHPRRLWAGEFLNERNL